MHGPIRWVLWVLVGVLGALGFAVIAGFRGDGAQVNAIWMIVAGVCTYAVAYRFYSRSVARRVLVLDDTRATPAETPATGS